MSTASAEIYIREEESLRWPLRKLPGMSTLYALLRLSVPNPKEALRKHETNSYTTRFVSNGKSELENEIGIKWEKNKVRQHVTVEKV